MDEPLPRGPNLQNFGLFVGGAVVSERNVRRYLYGLAVPQ